MRKGYKYLIWLVLLLCLIYQSFPSYAQEPLKEKLKRGKRVGRGKIWENRKKRNTVS
jgi:hypothetical protein